MTRIFAETTLALPSHRGWHFSLWGAQILLAGLFGMAGTMKLLTPLPELAAAMAWAGDVPPMMVRFIGLSELAGAIGLVLPALTRIKPGLTPLAGGGLAVVMVLAVAFHVSRGEISLIGINLLLGGLAALVAWGRWQKAPITPR